LLSSFSAKLATQDPSPSFPLDLELQRREAPQELSAYSPPRAGARRALLGMFVSK
jgi:hypothetical protein